MDSNGASEGELIPFHTLVLDADGGTLVPRPRPTSERARQFRAQADAPATLRAYAADWRHFAARACLKPALHHHRQDHTVMRDARILMRASQAVDQDASCPLYQGRPRSRM